MTRLVILIRVAQVPMWLALDLCTGVLWHFETFLGIPGFKYSRVFLVCCRTYTQKRSIDGEDYLYCGEATDTIRSTYRLVIIHINCSNLDGTLTGDHKTVVGNLLNCCKYNLISNVIGKQGKNIS